MLPIIGIVLVIAGIVGGFLMEHGNLLVLMQPGELVIIGGAAIGTVLIANPLGTLIRLAKAFIGVIKGSRYTEAFYLSNLAMLYDIFQYARKAGLAKLEGDVDKPNESDLFKKYPKFLADHHALDFICDTFRTSISGGVEPFDLDQLMEIDMDVSHSEDSQYVSALSTVADALPGLGIVAAVLGIVVTMGALGGPPEELGKKVAAALVGTFIGILLCYGFVGPLAGNLANLNASGGVYFQFLRTALIASLKGAAPLTAVEFGRRAIPPSVRPSFEQMETTCRTGTAAVSSEEIPKAA
jgi:chemotaxis protein MotA